MHAAGLMTGGSRRREVRDRQHVRRCVHFRSPLARKQALFSSLGLAVFEVRVVGDNAESVQVADGIFGVVLWRADHPTVRRRVETMLLGEAELLHPRLCHRQHKVEVRQVWVVMNETIELPEGCRKTCNNNPKHRTELLRKRSHSDLLHRADLKVVHVPTACVHGEKARGLGKRQQVVSEALQPVDVLLLEALVVSRARTVVDCTNVRIHRHWLEVVTVINDIRLAQPA